MEKELLNLTPKRFLCPNCGGWHRWNGRHELGYYDSISYKASLECSNVPPRYDRGNYRIFFDGNYLYYSTERMCISVGWMDGRIPISSILEDPDKPIVTFDVEVTSSSDVGMYACRECDYRKQCNYVRLGDEGENYHTTITFGFEFEQSDYNNISKAAQLARKERGLQKRENALKRKEQSAQQEIKEDATMANNIFNMNMEFGLNKDENIMSTLMGVAVKNGDSWRIYDKKKKEITDVGDMQLGKLPIFILPTTKLNKGDLIKDAGEYYFVMKVEKGSTQTLCAKTGEMKTVIPIKNVLGFSCYSKIIALNDSINMGDDFDVEKLAIMSAMCSQTGEDGGLMNQLLLLMFFKDKLGGDDDMMKMVLMSSMMGGNMAGNDNPVMGYLMLDMFMGKKKDEKAQQPAQAPTGNPAE